MQLQFRIGFCLSLATSCALVAFGAAAEPADIEVMGAEIAAGKLVVTGTTRTPYMKVRLDARSDPNFNVTSDGKRSFTFRLVYLPSDCIISLRKLTTATKLGAANEAVVANCGPGLAPRGAWDADTEYSANELVTYGGASWLAKRDSINQRPDAGDDWQLFTARIAKGA